MHIGKILEERGKSLSFEFFPPKEEAGEVTLFETVKKLKEMNPTFVSVTYGAGGSTSRNTEKIVTRINREFGIIAMPHMTIVNQSKEDIKASLVDYQKLEVDNILALRGDLPQGSNAVISRNGDFHYARDLVKLALSMKYSVAVAVYPEGHLESPSIEKDIEYTKQKIDEGAEFAITQMFFDNNAFYRFMERIRKAGVTIPIIPGILPVTDVNRVQQFAEKCGASLPKDIVSRFSNARTPGEMRKIGLETTTDQCADLMKNGVNYFHFYTLNRTEAVTEVINNVGLKKLTN